MPQKWVTKIKAELKKGAAHWKAVPLDTRWFLGVLKSIDYVKYTWYLGQMVELNESLKGTKTFDIPGMIRNDWGLLLEKSKALTINKA